MIHNLFYGWKGDKLDEILETYTNEESQLREAAEILNSKESIKDA